MNNIINCPPLKIRDLEAKIPIIQGGMGVGISLSGLAGAVAKEGGIGVISTAQIGYDEKNFNTNPIEANMSAIEKHISKAKEISNGGIIGVNIMVATRYYDKYVKRAVECGADIIISGAGVPVMLPEYVKGSNTKIAPIVSTSKSAQVILKYWDKKYNRCPDLIVVEGPLAGGHLGFNREEIDELSISRFYQREVEKIVKLTNEYSLKYKYKIPVVLAGGIYCKEQVNKIQRLNIDGIQVGSRFVTTYECDASMEYKQAYINASEKDIIIIKSPVGMNARAIKNKFLDTISNKTSYKSIGKCHQCLEKCNPHEISYCITEALINAVKGNIDEGLIFCGANAYRSKKIETVHEVIESLL